MSDARIALCGAFEIELDGQRLETAVRGAQSRLLLAYLVLNRERPVRRDELEDALWADARPSARNALAPPLSRLRAVVGGHRLPGGAQLQLELGETAWVDVEAAKAAVAAARAASDPRRAAEAAAAAAAICSGGLLPGLEAEWLEAHRAELRDLHAEALELEARAALAVGADELPRAARSARAAVDLLPFRESAWLILVEALQAQGNGAEALRAFEEVRTLLREEIGAVPGAALLAAHEALLREDASAAPPVTPPRSHLPGALTPFVGRTVELGALVALLERDDVRLVTLTGPGGIGKSRLALAAAGDLVERFPDGVRFVELASISNPDLVDSALAAELGVRLPGRANALDGLKAHLRGRRMLLVLDNFEQIADAGPLVSELLADAPGVKALVTSRTLLRLGGEHRVALEPLAPDDAQTLFAQRARAVHPGFEPTSEVAELCDRLDGLPLAIELAAARSALLTPAALLARLDDRLALLTEGPRDAPERQRTLRRTVQWSYELLEPAQQTLLSRLSVFPSSFDLVAAEAVGTRGGDVVGALGALVDASLVRREDRDGAARFLLLETVRHYAAEQAHAVRDDARRRHAAHYLSLAEAAEPELKTSRQRQWLLRLGAEHANLRAALRWSIQHEPEWAVRLGWALCLFWWLHGHIDEAVRWFEEIVPLAPRLSPVMRGRAISKGGIMAVARGDYASARTLLEAGLLLHREAGDEHAVAVVAGTLGHVANVFGEPDAAAALLTESLARLQAQGDAWFGAVMRNFHAWTLTEARDLAGAERELLAALPPARAFGDTLPLMLTLSNLADVRAARGDGTGAKALLREGLAAAACIDDVGSIRHFLSALAELDWQQGEDLERAVLLAGAVDGLRETTASTWLDAFTARDRERTMIDVSAVAALGERCFAAVWARGRALGRARAVAFALTGGGP